MKKRNTVVVFLIVALCSAMALTAFAEANRSIICWGDVYFESVDPQTGGIQPQMKRARRAAKNS